MSRRMIPPPDLGLAKIVIAIEKADPIPVPVASRQTNQFRTQPRDDDAQSALLVGQDVEQRPARSFAVENFIRCDHGSELPDGKGPILRRGIGAGTLSPD